MIELIKEIREETGLSIDKIRKALAETSGDKVKALEILNDSLPKDRPDPDKWEGRVFFFQDSPNEGVLISLLCETDFVSRSPEFEELARNVHEDFLNWGGILRDAEKKFGEKLNLGDVQYFTEQKGVEVYGYVHQGRVGAIVSVQDVTNVKDLLLHIVAMNPTPENFLTQPWVKDESITVRNAIGAGIILDFDRIDLSQTSHQK